MILRKETETLDKFTLYNYKVYDFIRMNDTP